MVIHCDDIDLHYDLLGDGPDVVLLHPFPSSGRFWIPLSERLVSRYRLVIPDLRGLGATQPGDGVATMQRHAEDLRRLCDELKIGKAVFVGCSIGGYILFEAWRSFRERFRGLVLTNTKAEADDEVARANRLKAAEDVLLRGPESFISATLPKLVGESTQRNRPDLFAAARATTASSTAQGIAAVQRGMAARLDSTRTLASIDIPTLVIAADEDPGITPSVMQALSRGIPNSRFHVIPAAGHYAPFERPDDFARLLRQFLESLPAA